jgi:hypothetical protein
MKPVNLVIAAYKRGIINCIEAYSFLLQLGFSSEMSECILSKSE